MSYGPAEAGCFHCEKIVWLALDHEVRDGQPVHTECAKEIDEDYPTDAELAVLDHGPQL